MKSGTSSNYSVSSSTRYLINIPCITFTEIMSQRGLIFTKDTRSEGSRHSVALDPPISLRGSFVPLAWHYSQYSEKIGSPVGPDNESTSRATDQSSRSPDDLKNERGIPGQRFQPHCGRSTDYVARRNPKHRTLGFRPNEKGQAAVVILCHEPQLGIAVSKSNQR